MKTRIAYIVTAALFALACGGNETSGGSSGGADHDGSAGTSGTAGSGGTATAGAGGSQDASAGGGGSAGSGASGTGGVAGTGASGGNGGSNSGGSAGTGGSSGGTGGAADGGGGSAGTGGSGGGAADGGSCAMSCTNSGLACCGSACVNLHNDILNCGACNHRCDGPSPFCNSGTCGVPPCQADAAACGNSGGTCCAGDCCTGGMICCQVNRGPSFTGCTEPVNGTCPVGCPACVCASPDTPIATPQGSRPIAALREGDLIYSVHRGSVVIVPLLAVQRVAVDRHVVQRVVLASGAALEISARHPTADGRTFADLRPGETLDGVAIRDVTVVPYPFEFTYDILPASDSAAYFAGGALIGSTMATQHTSVDRITIPMSYGPELPR